MGPTGRILHVAQPVEAGVAVVVAQLAAYQRAGGREVAVACPPDGPLSGWIESAGATVLPWAASRGPGIGVAGETARLAALVREWSPDLVHLHSSKAGLAGRLAVRGRVPTVYQPHAWSFLAVTGAVRALTLWWERRAARWTQAFVCVSESEQELGRRAGLTGRWFVCANGVDTVAFRPAGDEDRRAARQRLGLPPDDTVVLCVGRLCEQKGQDVLLQAWERVRRPGSRLVLVGDGPDRASLEASAGAAVDFAGDSADVTSWYAAADLFVQPSRWEGASLTTREAMSSGLCTVLTDVAGARDALGDEGTVVAVGDADALAGAVAARLDDPALREREGARARDRAEQLFGLAAALGRIDAVYESVMTVPR